MVFVAASVWQHDGSEDLLRRLWTEEGESFGQIAKALTTATGQTVTRNTVAGRIRRLGLTGKQAPAQADPAPPVTPPPAAGEGGAESILGTPISEQDQQVGPEPEVRGEPREAPRNMHAAMHVEPAAELSIVPAKISVPTHAPGMWPIADTREGQCKFACTPHSARPELHRFCGEPVAWKGGKPTSWCREHLDVVSGAPGRASGGASVADVTNGRAVPEREPARSGWGATGA